MARDQVFTRVRQVACFLSPGPLLSLYTCKVEVEVARSLRTPGARKVKEVCHHFARDLALFATLRFGFENPQSIREAWTPQGPGGPFCKETAGSRIFPLCTGRLDPIGPKVDRT